MPRRLRFAALGLAAVFCAATAAYAIHDVPRRSDAVRATVGRTMGACTAPDTVHGPPVSVGACTIVSLPSAYSFGPAGRGDVRLRRTKDPDVRVAVRLADVRDPSGVKSDGLFETEVLLRITDDSCAPSCTAEDLAVRIPTPCSRGKCRGRSTVGEALSIGPLALGAEPANVAVERIQILDPLGAPFAEPAMVIIGPASEPHNVPRDGRRATYDLGRAYGECTAPNTAHDPALPVGACSPHAALSIYQYGPKGRGQVKLTRIAGPDVRIQVLLRDVRTIANEPADGAFTTEVVLRISDTGCGPVPCTTEDVTVVVDTPCSAGVCRGKTTVDTVLGAGAVTDELGPSTIALQDVTVLDPFGAAFAAPAVKLP